MRVTFPRLPDRERAWALVERDDGVVFRFYGGGTAGPRLPHDIMHLVVERELRISDGIWAGVAAGAGLQHVSGRRPPHAAEVLRCALRGLRADWRPGRHADAGEDQAADRGQARGAARRERGPGGGRGRGPGPAGGSGPLGAAEGGRGAEL